MPVRIPGTVKVPARLQGPGQRQVDLPRLGGPVPHRPPEHPDALLAALRDGDQNHAQLVPGNAEEPGVLEPQHLQAQVDVGQAPGRVAMKHGDVALVAHPQTQGVDVLHLRGNLQPAPEPGCGGLVANGEVMHVQRVLDPHGLLGVGLQQAHVLRHQVGRPLINGELHPHQGPEDVGGQGGESRRPRIQPIVHGLEAILHPPHGGERRGPEPGGPGGPEPVGPVGRPEGVHGLDVHHGVHLRIQAGPLAHDAPEVADGHAVFQGVKGPDHPGEGRGSLGRGRPPELRLPPKSLHLGLRGEAGVALEGLVEELPVPGLQRHVHDMVEPQAKGWIQTGGLQEGTDDLLVGEPAQEPGMEAGVSQVIPAHGIVRIPPDVGVQGVEGLV